MARRLTVGTLVAIAALAFAARARADGLTVSTLEYASWPEAIAALQGDTSSGGRTVHVVIRDDGGEPAACGWYTLTLDDAGARAFEIGACDAATSATELRLVQRTELFAHDDFVPRPRAIGISAVETRVGGAAGGAGRMGGSELYCRVAVRPFVSDLEHGTRVYLSPGRFVMRALAASVTAAPAGDGWTLESGASGSLTVEYEVEDTARGEVVVRDRATLACSTDPPIAPAAVRPLAIVAPHMDATAQRRTRSVVPFILLGAGAAAAVAGGVLALEAASQADSVAASLRPTSSARDSAETMQMIGEVMLGVGLVDVAAGIVLAVTDVRPPTPWRPRYADRRRSLFHIVSGGLAPTSVGTGATASLTATF